MEHDSSITELDDIASEYQRRLDAGEPADLDEFVQQHPKYAQKLSARFATANAGGNTEKFHEPSLRDDSAHGITGSPGSLPPTKAFGSDDEQLADDILPLGPFGDYEILKQVARGGMGIVYLARQISLNRIVALKTIRHGRSTSPKEIERFHKEARSAAVLHHPNIAPVYEIGVVNGQHYFTMEYVEGRSLADLISDRPLNEATAAEYLSGIARTVEYAHQQKIVHRDLKPSNVLITADGQPCITDFGVAAAVERTQPDAGRREVVGTPSFMSPEQSLAVNGAASPAADIYSLGAILFALLTGRPPFQAETAQEALELVRTCDPVNPRSLNANIPLDLETICLKCLRKEPHRRYATAGDLADDLTRYLNGQPIAARPIGRVGRLWRACRRNPAVASLMLGSAFLAVALIVGLTYANVWLNRLNSDLVNSNRELDQSQLKLSAALSAAQIHQREAELSKAKAEQLLYVADMREAGRAWQDDDVRNLTTLLERHQPVPGAPDYRRGEWHFLWNHARIPHEVVSTIDEPLYFMCYSPDGQTIATAGKDAVIRVYYESTFRLRMAIPTEQIEVNGLAFSPDGQTLVSAGDDGTLRLWKIDWQQNTAEQVRSIPAHEQQAYNVLFTPDAKTIISAGNDSVIRLWDPLTGESKGMLDGHREEAGAIACSFDGRMLASAGRDGRVILWDLSSRKPLRTIDPRIDRLLCVAFSPDGTMVAAGARNHQARVWSVETGELVQEFEHLDIVQRVTFTPDGATLITSDYGGMIHAWTLSPETTRKALPRPLGTQRSRTWNAHRGRIYAITIAPDGESLVSVGGDGKMVEWTFSAETSHRKLTKSDGEITEMAFTATGNLLATVDEKRVEIWQPESGQLVRQLFQSESELLSLAISADGSTLAAGAIAGDVYVWDMNADKLKLKCNVGNRFDVSRIALSPDGSMLATVDRFDSVADGLYVLDVATGNQVEGMVLADSDSAAFSIDGRWLLASGPQNVVAVWDTHSSHQVAVGTGHVRTINKIAFSPDSRLALTASDDRLIRIWDSTTWETSSVLAGHRSPVLSVAFTPDGQTIASVGEDSRLKLWNVATQQELLEIDFSPARLEQIAFSPDGRFLCCLIEDGDGDGRSVHILDWRRTPGEIEAP